MYNPYRNKRGRINPSLEEEDDRSIDDCQGGSSCESDCSESNLSEAPGLETEIDPNDLIDENNLPESPPE